MTMNNNYKQSSRTQAPSEEPSINADSPDVGGETYAIKPSFIVNSAEMENESFVKRNQSELKTKINFDGPVDIEQITDEPNDIVQQISEPVDKSSWSKRWWIILCVLVGVVSVAELSHWILYVVNEQDWLGGMWLAIVTVVFFGVTHLVVSEVRSLKQLKRQTEFQQYSKDLFHTPAIGLGQTHCENIAKQLPEQYQPFIADWRKHLQSHYTNSEVLSLFETKVLSHIDKIALRHITKNASAAGVMIAVSPFAMVDMLIVLWRNLIMINRLSRLYGVRLGYWGRIALIKKIFRSMLYAGAMEIVSDAGNYALGVGITGKLSSRVAQGMGVGILTSRIGLKALNECRPMPWLTERKPGLNSLSNQVLADLTKLVK